MWEGGVSGRCSLTLSVSLTNALKREALLHGGAGVTIRSAQSTKTRLTSLHEPWGCAVTDRVVAATENDERREATVDCGTST